MSIEAERIYFIDQSSYYIQEDWIDVWYYDDY